MYESGELTAGQLKQASSQLAGMTLRDYFAAKAMQSMNGRQDYLDAPASAIALDAYALADAMLKAREA
jgi:Mor family transcriptional regulator